MGRETVKLLMEHDLVSNFDDLFELTRDELTVLPGFEEKKAWNLLKGVENAKNVPFDRFLIGLGIEHVGGETARLLTVHFPTLAALAAASEESLSRVDGVGPVIGQAVAGWCKDKNNRAQLARLGKHLRIKRVAVPRRGPLTGQTVVVTGTLENLSREEAETRVREAGGKIVSSVSKKTSFVLAGGNPGSKLDKARELNVRVITEKEFKKRLT